MNYTLLHNKNGGLSQTALDDKSFSQSKPNQGRLPNAIWTIVNTPIITVGTCLLVAVVCYFISFHLSLLFLSGSYVFIAYYIERQHLNTLAVPPLAIFALATFFHGSLGSVLASYNLSAGIDDPLLITQAGFVLTFPIFIVIYWLINRKNQPIILPDFSIAQGNLYRRQMRLVAIMIVGFTIMLHFVQIATGVADRGYAGDFLIETPYGVWSYFEAFSKLQYIGYMLIPFLYRTSNKIVRLGLVTFLVVYILFQLANSSRGAVVFPLIFVCLGYWMIGGGRKQVIIYLLALVAILLLITPFLGEFRSSIALRTTRLVDLGDRLHFLYETVKSHSHLTSKRKVTDLQVTGFALLGCSDPLIYANTLTRWPFAGWEGMEAVFYVWVPNMFYRDKPKILDGNEITVQYSGVRFARSGITPSIQADLYRRFGWFGVIIGYPFYAFAASLLVKYGFNSFHKGNKKKLYGLLVILFVTSFLHGIPFGTVLTMIWNFLYDYPKYLLVLGMIAFFAKRIRW